MQINQGREKKIDYPAQCTFKAVFRSSAETETRIVAILEERDINGDIHQKESSNGKFISYTVTAEFPSREVLHETCRSISTLKGYMTLF